MHSEHHSTEVARFVTADDWQRLQSRALTPDEMTRYPGPMHKAYAQARLDDLDAIVRREMAKELDSIAATIRRGDEDDSLSDGWTSFYAELVEKRVEEIRNG